jgi:hypothetical protein
MACRVQCAAAIYSASHDDVAGEACFFELQEMAPPPSIKTNPEVDRRSSKSLAQSESE